MRLLLDENLPVDLRQEVSGHDCETVTYRGWNGKKNGELLQSAADADFDALITNDGNLPYQQDQAGLPIAVVLLNAPTNKLDDIRPLIPALLSALEDLTPNAVTLVEATGGGGTRMIREGTSEA